MKILIIFRGMNARVRTGIHDQGTQTQDALNCITNWAISIFKPLREAHITYDIILITYPSSSLETLVSLLHPIKVVTEGYSSRDENMAVASRYMTDYQQCYDRFLMLRFDLKYRVSITKWPKWHEKGLIIVNRDRHWPSVGGFKYFTADMLFVVDRESVNDFYKALNCEHQRAGHSVGRYLHEHHISYHLMYHEYYNMFEHPLHAMDQFEEEPVVDGVYIAHVQEPIYT